MKALLSQLCAIMLLASASAAQAQQVRYFEQNGVTYRETREVVRRPVYETTWQDRPCVACPAAPPTRRCYRTERVPVTEYRTVPRWVGLYNPFAQPYLVYDQVPVVRYETRTVAYDVPVPAGRTVPVTGTMKVPVVTQRMVDEEVLRRVAVSGPGLPTNLAAQPPAGQPPATAARATAPVRSEGAGNTVDPFARPAPIVSTPMTRPAVGGVGQLESDPPREGTGWRAVR